MPRTHRTPRSRARSRRRHVVFHHPACRRGVWLGNTLLILLLQVPKSVEDKLPDAVHDTGSNSKTGKVSHATGDSIVPKTLQEGLPEKVEKVVPNAIHDTSGAKFSDGSVSK